MPRSLKPQLRCRNHRFVVESKGFVFGALGQFPARVLAEDEDSFHLRTVRCTEAGHGSDLRCDIDSWAFRIGVLAHLFD
jgi:hypothetical protein